MSLHGEIHEHGRATDLQQRIRDLEAELEKAAQAMEPFERAASPESWPTMDCHSDAKQLWGPLTFGHIRRAAEARRELMAAMEVNP